MKKTNLLLLLLVVAMGMVAQEQKTKTKGYVGGMMVHSGYISGSDFAAGDIANRSFRVAGPALGIGGKMAFYLGDHFRVGSEGYASSTTYGKNKSSQRTGFGGILAEGIWNFNRWSLFGGATFGGASVTNTVITENRGLSFDTQDIIYRKYGMLILDPFLGVEYALTAKMHLCMKADYLLNISNPQADFASGVRIYFGFLFRHVR